MNTRVKTYLLVATVFVFFTAAQQAWSSEDFIHQFARDASNSITPFLIVGELSLLTEGKAAKTEMVQGAEALVATALLTEALKDTVREKRPHGESLTSFPSGHASAAFAMATVVGDYKPKYKLPAYGIATVIAWSRVEVGAHRWHDVLAGAALGYFAAKHFTKHRSARHRRQYIAVCPEGISYQWAW